MLFFQTGGYEEGIPTKHAIKVPPVCKNIIKTNRNKRQVDRMY